ncbi:unnamed protein product [Paramecium octaurelia]|uniref:G domain-containing protein n=1 Tax=Paramecium octaurelia TaxID=43137 RepID=A0A8S1UNE3_PAROT|nr:unnamed protein product [Paramecium octaurelia]
MKEKQHCLNAFINYYFETSWYQKSKLVIANDEPITEISSYYLEPYNYRSYGIHLMDTPSISGWDDQDVIDKIFNLIEEFKQSIDLIVICLKATHSRLTEEAKQILSTIANILDIQDSNKLLIARTFYSGGQVDFSFLAKQGSPFQDIYRFLSNSWHLEFNGASLVQKPPNSTAPPVYFQKTLENFKQLAFKIIAQKNSVTTIIILDFKINLQPRQFEIIHIYPLIPSAKFSSESSRGTSKECNLIKQNLQNANSFKFYQLPTEQPLQLDDINDLKTLVLIGDTGAGKSTMINFFCNYQIGVQFEDPFRVIIKDRIGKDFYQQQQKVYISNIKEYLFGRNQLKTSSKNNRHSQF